MATVNDIAQVLATGLGLRTGAVMEHVRAAMADGFLPDGEADADAAAMILLTVAVSELSGEPGQTPDMARLFSDMPITAIKIWNGVQVVESDPPLDNWIAVFPTKTFGAFLSVGFAGHLLTGDSDTRNCAHLALGFVDGAPAAQVRVHPDDNPTGLVYQFARDGELSPGTISREVTFAQPFYFLRMALGFAETIEAVVEPTHYDITTRRQ